MAYKLKIGPAQGLKLKGQAGFALPMIGGIGIKATKSGGIWTVDLDYTVLTPGPISDAATAFIAIEDKTSGIYREVSLASLLTSGLDADLQAIAALTSTGVLVRTADDTWALRTITGTANEITVTNGDGVSGNPTVSLPAALTFTGKTVTGGTYTGVVSINGNMWTAGTGTLTLGAGKTATISNTLTFTGTDGSTAAFGAGGTVAYQGGTLAQFAATTSAQLRGVLSDETGTGAAYFQGGDIGTPSAGVATNLTGTASGLTAGNVTTNANLTGDVTSVGNASTIAANAVTNAKLATAADGTIKSNISGSSATPSDNTITAVLDKLFGTTQGSVIYRGASTWGALTPGTSGNFLKTLGAGANPAWASIPGGGDLLSTNNLSDVVSAATSRVNLSAFGVVRIQKFTASGTYTPHANMLYALIECQGGGGGGGYAGTFAGASLGVGGGGAGAYAFKVTDKATVGASQPVTIGAAGDGGTSGTPTGTAGGTTSVGTICTAAGGGASVANNGPGAGGTTGTGDVIEPGGSGSIGTAVSGSPPAFLAIGGIGGKSRFGSGTGGVSGTNTAQAGAAGTGYGAGGSGGATYNNAGGTANGGAGTAGIVVITEYCSQ